VGAEVASSLFVSSQALASVEEHAPVLSTAREIPKTQAQVRRPPLASVFTDPNDVAGVARAYLECGYNQQEIADHLGVHDSTVSRRVHAIDSCRRRNTMRDCRA
jgi:hypothetical protein